MFVSHLVQNNDNSKMMLVRKILFICQSETETDQSNHGLRGGGGGKKEEKLQYCSLLLSERQNTAVLVMGNTAQAKAGNMHYCHALLQPDPCAVSQSVYIHIPFCMHSEVILNAWGMHTLKKRTTDLDV